MADVLRLHFILLPIRTCLFGAVLFQSFDIRKVIKRSLFKLTVDRAYLLRYRSQCWTKLRSVDNNDQ